MALINKKVKGSTMIESIMAFTLILLALGLGLTVITQVQSQQHLRNSNALNTLKKVHANNKYQKINKTTYDELEVDKYIIERTIKKAKFKTLHYHYNVKTRSGQQILKYDYIEQE